MSKEAEDLKSDIDTLKIKQDRIFSVGYQREGKGAVYMLLVMLGIFIGLFGVVSVLIDGASVLDAVALGIGVVSIKLSIDHDKNVKWHRDEWQKNRAVLDGMEERYRVLTYVPKTAEQIEREHQEFMRELAEDAATPSKP